MDLLKKHTPPVRWLAALVPLGLAGCATISPLYTAVASLGIPAPPAPLSPPSWLQGSWSDASGRLRFGISSHDVVMTIRANPTFQTIDFGQDLDSPHTEVQDATSYHLTFTPSTGATDLLFAVGADTKVYATLAATSSGQASSVGPFPLTHL